MKYQVLFSLKNNEKVFINVVCCSHGLSIILKTDGMTHIISGSAQSGEHRTKTNLLCTLPSDKNPDR